MAEMRSTWKLTLLNHLPYDVFEANEYTNTSSQNTYMHTQAYEHSHTNVYILQNRLLSTSESQIYRKALVGLEEIV